MVASADVNVSVAHVRRNVMHLSIELTAEEAEYLKDIVSGARDDYSTSTCDDDVIAACDKVLEALENAVC